ncbi:MAG TPA: extracellular solute-binding protein [Trebonia sp.]|jgi:raffinose/stachyose/melibiose transport system substrate-binding protein|nr:extracellular solute-binding protein [Trebonia sp.]
MHRKRVVLGVAVAAAAATVLAACSSGGSSSTSSNSSSSSAKVTLSWWNNANTQPLLGVFTNIIKQFQAAHPNVTIHNVPMQNELFKTKVTPALRGNSPPDIFQQWGSGQQATQVQSGKLADISSNVSPWIGSLGTPATEWQTNGKWYGVPYDLHVVGFWYRKDLFRQAGITSPPTTIAQLESDDATLRAHGITPITVGSKDGWPDAFWWEYFAVRECSQSTITQAMSGVSLSAPCFTKASADLDAFMKTNPFQTGFLATPAQSVPNSSVALLANGKAAMELQGDWDPGAGAGLTSDKNLFSKLGWFPFPSVPGGAGNPKAVLGGGDGYSCTTGASEPACAEFLQFLTTPAVQKQIIGAGVGLPANPAANSDLTVPAEQDAAAANSAAPYIAEYFDIALPTTPGQNLDNAVAKWFASPEPTGSAIVSSVSAP